METKNIILKLRTERGMSQDELADKIMVTRQAVSRWQMDANIKTLYELSVFNKKTFFDIAVHIAKILNEYFYDLDFRISELYQMNRLLNHQIAHNVIFVFVEKELCISAFERLKKEYEGNILINPTEFLEKDEERFILISSHISSDLESLCDDLHMDFTILAVVQIMSTCITIRLNS